jgi:hypothetical protein
MDKNELELYIEKSYTYKQLSDHFLVSQSTIRHWMKKYGLKTKNNRYNNAGKRSALVCKMCNDSTPDNFYKRGVDEHYHLCKSCFKKTHGAKRLARSRRVKAEWVAYKGGACVKCGYNRCSAALEFHHLDPNQKDPNWNSIRHLELEVIKTELDKCQLLCSNCHRELHFGVENLGT